MRELPARGRRALHEDRDGFSMKRAVVICVLGAALFLAAGAVVSVPGPLGAWLNAQPGSPLGQADPVLQLSDRFETVAARVLPAVVSVEAVKPPKVAPDGKSKPVEESGSGVIVKLDGRPGHFVLTNNHVIAQARPDQITLSLPDGRIYHPTLVRADPESDIAVLTVDAPTLPTAPLGNSDQAKVGRWVLAVGSPFGLSQTVTHGIISARDRGQVSLGGQIRIKEFLQTDAAINPGSSGGPLVDMHGDVIGINTAIASHNGNNSGVAFAIPINLVKRIAGQLVTTGVVQRGYLGMLLAQTFDGNDALKLGMDRLRGALVEKIYADSPAAAAGLQVRDVILQVESVPIKNDTHLINLVSNLPPGHRVRLQVWRDRTVVSLDAIVGDWSKAQVQGQ